MKKHHVFTVVFQLYIISFFCKKKRSFTEEFLIQILNVNNHKMR